MSHLVLAELSLHPYQPNLACAYIYYEVKKTLVDHTNKPISTLNDFPDELIHHLKSNVMPALIKNLKNSSYTPVDVEVVNQAPHPFITIQRKDGMVLFETDKKKISNDLTNALAMINNHSQDKIMHNRFLSKRNNITRKALHEHKIDNAANHHYNLRK